MVIPKSAHVDNLDVSTLRGPLLDDYYGSAIQKADVGAVANEIMRRHMAKLPTDTGKLKSTAKVTYHRSVGHQDRRWEAEYSVGGPSADYIVPLEDEHHYLDAVLNEMGFFVGDIVNGPTGKIPKSEQAPAPHVDDEREAGIGNASTTTHYQRQADVVDRIQQPRRQPGSAAMERDVAELRQVMSDVEAEGGDTSLGRNALASYEALRQARAERDAFYRERPYFRD